MSKRTLTVTVEDIPDYPKLRLIRLDGTLDTINLKILNQDMIKLIKEGSIYLIAECSKLTYMNSTGLGGLIDYCRMTQEKGGDLKLAGVDEKVCEIISIVGADRFFDMHDNVENAIKAFDKILNK
jgi:anti-sigma B factor antagonist